MRKTSVIEDGSPKGWPSSVIWQESVGMSRDAAHHPGEHLEPTAPLVEAAPSAAIPPAPLAAATVPTAPAAAAAPTASPAHRHRVVVIGSGFGGLFGTQALKRADVDITLIAKTTHHLFQPLL